MAKRKKRRIGAFSRRLSAPRPSIFRQFANSIKNGLETQIGYSCLSGTILSDGAGLCPT
jgi:hypothetical protein